MQIYILNINLNKMKTSGFLKLDWNDLAKGAIVSVGTAVLEVVYTTIQAGSLNFNYKGIGIAAAAAFVTYLSKNLLTPAQIVTPVDKMVS